MAFSRDEALEMLGRALREGRLGHAYLIAGEPGSGVTSFADEFAALYLGHGGGSLTVSAHPDFHRIEPGSKSRRLLIEQIRDLEESLHRKASADSSDNRKVAVISDADRMMPQAANAFLKTLEEPPEGCLLLLTTELPEALLETIRSRCISVTLRRGAAVPMGARAGRLTEALPRFFSEGARCDATAAFSLTRLFRDLLEEVREESDERIKEELSAGKAHYGKTTEVDLDGREEILKASAESEVLRERSLLLGVIADHFGGELRALHAQGVPENPSSSRILLLRLAALERMRANLERGIQEALALEAGFLELMTLPEA